MQCNSSPLTILARSTWTDPDKPLRQGQEAVTYSSGALVEFVTLFDADTQQTFRATVGEMCDTDGLDPMVTIQAAFKITPEPAGRTTKMKFRLDGFKVVKLDTAKSGTAPVPAAAAA